MEEVMLPWVGLVAHCSKGEGGDGGGGGEDVVVVVAVVVVVVVARLIFPEVNSGHKARL
jgi:hypothetical protein